MFGLLGALFSVVWWVVSSVFGVFWFLISRIWLIRVVWIIFMVVVVVNGAFIVFTYVVCKREGG